MGEAEITEGWDMQPTASQEDTALVMAFLGMVEAYDNVAAAEEIDVREGTVRRWRRGDIRPLKKGMRAKLRRYCSTGNIPARGVEEELAATTPVVDPNTARRAIKAISPSDMKTRLAVIREYEDVYLEAGFAPATWPQWFRELRREVEGGGSAGGTGKGRSSTS